MLKPNEDTIEISLFPIPNCVCFPLSVQPLHVFEPRYREMVKDSVRIKRKIGICHTEKMVHAAKSEQTAAEILNTNQATYLPQKIFSAGYAEIVEVSPDGRLGVKVEMDERYEILEEIQTLPYRIVRCRPFLDKPPGDGETQHMRQKISRVLKDALLEESLTEVDAAATNSALSQLESLSDEKFSFKVFSFVRFEPELAQRILQMTSAGDRIQTVCEALRGGDL